MCLASCPSTTLWTRSNSVGRRSGRKYFVSFPFNNKSFTSLSKKLKSNTRSVLEYNVATMCPNQTCEPVEFLQVRQIYLSYMVYMTSWWVQRIYSANTWYIRNWEVNTFLWLFILWPQVAGLKVDFHIKKWNSGSRIAKIDLINEDGWVVWFPQFSSYRVGNLQITWMRYSFWSGICTL